MDKKNNKYDDVYAVMEDLEEVSRNIDFVISCMYFLDNTARENLNIQNALDYMEEAKTFVTQGIRDICSVCSAQRREDEKEEQREYNASR